MKHAREEQTLSDECHNRIQDPFENDPNGIGKHEPVFLLRAKDITAPGVVRFWTNKQIELGNPDKDLIQAGFDHAKTMEHWQEKFGSKMSDGPKPGTTFTFYDPEIAQKVTKFGIDAQEELMKQLKSNLLVSDEIEPILQNWENLSDTKYPNQKEIEWVQPTSFDFKKAEREEFLKTFPENMLKGVESIKQFEFRQKLEDLINGMSMENGSNSPDWILAEFLDAQLKLWDKMTNKRDKFFDSEIRSESKIYGSLDHSKNGTIDCGCKTCNELLQHKKCFKDSGETKGV
jgi:hypothetical protein